MSYSQVLASNEKALGETIQSNIASQRISLQGQNLYTDYLSLLFVGLGVNKLLVQGERRDVGLERIFPCIETAPQTQVACFTSYPLQTRINQFSPTRKYDLNQSDDETSHLFDAVATSQEFLNEILNLSYQSQIHPFDTSTNLEQSNHALIIGAGGIGTYVALELARRGNSQATIIDDDLVEEKNLNRQLLYTQSIGEPKAPSLASKLQLLTSKKINGINCRINTAKELEELQNKTEFDTIYCATDNFKSRLLVSQYCEAYKIPLIEGGCDTEQAVVSQYIPGETKPTHEIRQYERFVKFDEKETQNSCSQKVNPSVIIPNIAAAAMMIGLTTHPLIEHFSRKLGNRILSYNPTQPNTYEVLQPC